MTDLSLLANELDVSDRTLRRAAARGTVRCVRRGQRLELPVQEALYLQRRWPLLQTLVGELRTLPNVRLAVLFGSTARGDDDGRSDVDVLVRLAKRGLSPRALVLDRLEDATGRRVHLAEVEDANPLLLADVLRDGRVLVDRDEDWSRLVAKKKFVLAQAAADRASLDIGVERARGSARGNRVVAPDAPRIPVPIAQRISGLVTDYRTLQLVLAEVSQVGYRDALESRDPQRLKDVVYPLERAFEIANNYVGELVALGLEELGQTPIDGPADLQAFRDRGVIPQRMSDQLAQIHRARNDLTHDYPDVRAATIYKACRAQVKVIPAFLRAYAKWLKSLGYAASQ
jgi:predicted nucleotidyltransferase/uncharacterized protein YutE (UPF0331/DUF86 family)